MKYFKDQKNTVHAFEEDGSQDDFIGGNLVPITPAQAVALSTALPPFAAAKELELQAFRTDRQRMLDALSGIAGRLQRAGDTEAALACDVLSQGLLDLPSHTAVAAAASVTALRLAMKTRYTELISAVPARVLGAYKVVAS
jgi:hypothetical protein